MPKFVVLNNISFLIIFIMILSIGISLYLLKYAQYNVTIYPQEGSITYFNTCRADLISINESLSRALNNIYTLISNLNVSLTKKLDLEINSIIRELKSDITAFIIAVRSNNSSEVARLVFSKPYPKHYYRIKFVLNTTFDGFDLLGVDGRALVNYTLYLNGLRAVSIQRAYPSVLYRYYPAEIVDMNVSLPYVASVGVCVSTKVIGAEASTGGSSVLRVCRSVPNPFKPSVSSLSILVNLTIMPNDLVLLKVSVGK